MQANELVVQIKQRVFDIEAAQDDGKVAFVTARVEELRDFLNLAHADAEIAKAARHKRERAEPQPSSKLKAAIDKIE